MGEWTDAGDTKDPRTSLLRTGDPSRYGLRLRLISGTLDRNRGPIRTATEGDPMGVICKFRCKEITRRAGGSEHHPVTEQNVENQQVDVLLVACKTTEEDNVDWSRWTPFGELRMTITNPDGFRHFDVDADYTIEIRKSQPAKART